MEKNISRKSIAEIAGVSKTTVTRVLSDPESVSEETRKKVLDVIAELGYTQNKLAMNVSSNKNSNFVAMLVPDMSNYYYLEMFNCMVTAFEDCDYTISIYLVNEHNFSKILDKIIQNRVSAIINLAFTPFTEVYLKKLACANIKVIHPGIHEDPVKINIDYSYALESAFNAMIESGVKNFKFLCGTDKKFLSDGRITHYLSIMKRRGEENPEETLIWGNYPENNSALEEGYEDIKKILCRGENIEGLFCLNDMMAIGAMKALREKGYNVGKDVFVVGFDNISLGRFSVPALTTIDSFIGEEAKQYAGYILGKENKQQKIVSELILRQSLSGKK